MKHFEFFLFFGLFFIVANGNKNTTNNINSTKNIKKHSCGAGQINYKIKKVKFDNKKISQKRALDNNLQETYNPINIYYDMTYLNNQKENSSQDIKDKIDMVDKAMLRCINVFKKLINIKKPLNSKIKIKNEQDLKEWKFTKYKIDQNIMPKGEGILCDLLILIRFKNEKEEMKYEFPEATAVYIDEYTKRPILGILVINNEFEIKRNTQDYLEYLLLHSITHILGFSYNLFSSFPGQLSSTILIEKEIRTNKEKYKIKTPKVLEFAKKYFNCNSITGVELENKEDNIYPSHWEARILLGEYMNSEPYTPEQVISEFTLALLEDSGWYKVNYFTGGLMRFGKNQGCDFINKDCLKYKSFLYEVNFKNEFCDPSINWVPSCSSGRQSRSYCSTELNEIDPDFQRFGNYRGRANTDFCFINDFYPSEENLAHYVGNCKKGEGNYGSNILYNDNIKESNSKIPESFGEKYGNNSFCALSSVIPKNEKNKDSQIFNKYTDIIHSMCYPMFCTDKSLTIQINDQYIVCPKQGGKVELLGDYIGDIYCPDYNLICTGTVECNDMFDCVEKESLAKENTYKYDYKIQTSQHLPDLLRSDAVEGYEESETEGKCPKECHQCLNHKKCIKCKQNYKLIGVKKNDNNPILCKNTNDIELYYKDKEDNTYYKCPDYCLDCKNDGICTICDNIHRLDIVNNTCEEKVKYCEKYELNNEDCYLCKDNYFFINEDRRHCYNTLDDKSKYFPENNNKVYFSCEYGIPHCEQCLNKSLCIKCKDNYFFINEERSICFNKIDKKKYYPENNNEIYYSCDRNLPHCEECLNKNECTKCKAGYFFINEDRTQCYNQIDKKKYYPENNGEIYYLCNYNLPNCEECSDKNTCIKCKDGYFFINNDRTQCFNEIDKRKYYTEDNGKIYYSCEYNLQNCEECLDKNTCIKCKENYYFINEDRSRCYNKIDNNKYYLDDNGTTYYSCKYNLPNCEECLDKYTCIKCKENYFFINNDRSQCYNRLDDNDKYYVDESKTIYYSCNTSIPHCETCKNKTECTKCEDHYFFINEDRTKCYNEIDEKKFYPEEGGKIYYSCSHNIEHCIECENKTKCILCEDNYYLSGKNSLCYPISTVPFDKCKIIFSNLQDKNKIINKNNNYLITLINQYIKENKDKNYIIQHYKSNNNNYTITIFRAAICTKLLVKSGFYHLDTNEILKKVNLDYFYNNDNYIHCFITYGLQNYFILYNTEINSFLNLSSLSSMTYKISNNFTYGMNNLLGKQISEHIKIKNIDIFDTKESIFNNFCNNFTLQGVDIPYKYRLNKLYLGNISNEVICTSNKCKMSSVFINNFTGNCECDINEDINYLKNQPKNIFFDYYQNSTVAGDSFKIFGCFKKQYKLSSNVGLVIFLIFVIIHILCISLYFLFIKKIYDYKEIANPPNKPKKSIIEDETAEDKNENNDISCSNCDMEKKVQDKDIDFDIETINSGMINEKTIKDIKIHEKEEVSKIKNKSNINLIEHKPINFNDKMIYINKTNIFKDKEKDKENKNSLNLIKNDLEENNDKLDEPDISDLIYKKNKNKEESKDYSKSKNDIISEGKDLFKNKRSIKNKKDKLKCSENDELIDNKENLCTNDITKTKKEEFNEKNNSIIKINKVKKKNLKNTIYINCINASKKEEEKNNIKNVEIVNPNNKDINYQIDKMGQKEYKIEEKEEKKESIEEEKKQTIDEEKKFKYNENIYNKKKELVADEDCESKGSSYLDKNFKNLQKETSERLYFKKKNNLNNFLNAKNDVNKNKKFLILFKYKEDSDDEKNNNKSQLDLNTSVVDYLSLTKMNEKDNRTFINLYWHILSLKQPLINIFSFIKYFNITKSYIPLTIKINKFIFISMINIFVNSMCLSQKYFIKKYEYFNNKYNIQDNIKIIKSNEFVQYAMRSGFSNAMISFMICLVIYYSFEYIFFNIRRLINNISLDESININKINRQIIELMTFVKKKYLIYICISSFAMILFGIYIINFSFTYPGGVIDYISNSIITFIFLQIFPFITSLLVCYMRIYSLKKKNKTLYEFSQILFS